MVFMCWQYKGILKCWHFTADFKHIVAPYFERIYASLEKTMYLSLFSRFSYPWELPSPLYVATSEIGTKGGKENVLILV